MIQTAIFAALWFFLANATKWPKQSSLITLYHNALISDYATSFFFIHLKIQPWTAQRP